MPDHLIVHQFDPTNQVAGGIDGFIRDVIRFAPQTHDFSVVGVDASPGTRCLGRWTPFRLGNRTIRFMPVARLDAGDQSRRVPHTLRLMLGLGRHLRSARGAILHSHRSEVGAVLSALFPRAWKVQFIHGDAVVGLEHKTETYWRLMPGLHVALERFAVAKSDYTIIMSRGGARRLRGNSNRVKFGTSWYDGDIFSWTSRDESGIPRIGWAGRFEPPKDPLAAVETFARLKAQGASFTAWMAGAGTLAGATRKAIEERGLADNVQLLGLLRPHELGEELRRSQTFLMTSLWEGFPRAAVEALACGVPVVSTDVGEAATLLSPGTNGFIAASRDPAELASLVTRSWNLERGRRVASTVAGLDAGTVVPRLLEEIVEAGPKRNPD